MSLRAREGSAGLQTEEVVPVFGGGAQALNGGVKIAHPLGHKVARGISVKAAVDGQALLDKSAEPRRVGSGPRSG